MDHEQNPAKTFEGTVIAQLSIIATKIEAIETHLATLNGRVVKQEKENFERQLELSKHASDCPVREIIETRIKPMEEQLRVISTDKAAADAVKTTQSRWLKNMSPAIWTVVGAIGILILTHSKEVLAAFGK